KRSQIAQFSGESSKLSEFSYSNPVLDISAKIQIWYCRTADLFFGGADFRLDGRPFFAETQLGEFTVSKANLLAERSLSLVW
ncbi:hypothetical protein D6A01_24595, partial [Vibrio parahaemolyticus]|nr:hypothetical protein [Vibrio parahaemolyticus]